MVNTRQKGWRVANKCRILLEKDGWLVGDVEKTSRFAKVKDLFGLFDKVCIKPGIVMFVQITSNVQHPHKKYHAFANIYGNESIWIEQWVHMDYHGFKRFKYYPTGIKEVEKC